MRKRGRRLCFSINPTEFVLNRSFDFQLEPQLGQASPMVAFRCGGLTHLSFDLVFDQDADKDCDLKKVEGFLSDLNKINKETRSVAPLEFSMGSFSFKGYMNGYTLQAVRFNEQGDATSLHLSATLISTGEFEQKGAK
ncbi:MAG: hypothetical protein R3B54_02155 [Bdellovibrionota bacterium]